MDTVYALKWLNADGTPCHGGSGAWPLPTQQADGSWQPGDWREATGPRADLCTAGVLHATTLVQARQWFAPACWLVEMTAPLLWADDKLGSRRARLVRPLAWDGRGARHYAADCAERVLPLFEARYPSDARPRQAIAAARRYADGQVPRAVAATAYAADAADAAAAAAYAADAADAAYAAAAAAYAADAAAAAYADAAYAAAAAAYADAAYADAAAAYAADAAAAEKQWQADHLAAVLGLTADEIARLARQEEAA